MLTRCPTCQAWFRVRAEHLSAASGYVTCGQCDAVFNALETLVEDRVPPPLLHNTAPEPTATTVPAETPPAVPATLAAAAETAAAAPLQLQAPLVASPSAAERIAAGGLATVSTPLTNSTPTAGAANADAEPAQSASDADTFDDFDFAAPADDDIAPAPATGSLAAPVEAEGTPGAQPPDPAGNTLTAAEHAILFTEPGSANDNEREPAADNTAQQRDNDDDEDRTEPDAVPAMLEEEIAALRGQDRNRTGLSSPWGLTTAMLLMLTCAQAAFIYRAAVASAWPASVPVFARICAALDCRDTAAAAFGVRLLARDVREHPQYRDALLVNATLANSSSSAQPFPIIELRLHDGVGAIVGARRFAPAEYLDDSIEIASGMAPQQPIYVVMEVGGDASRATSFEFTFL